MNRRPSRAFWLFALIFVAGTAFRFFNLGSVRHGFDEGYPAYDALRILDGHQFLLLGQPSSVFLDNPPLMAYLQAIPLLAWRSPWAVYLFITALNTLGIWFVYRVARQLLGERAALAAAFLYAVNPWMVHFSQMPWHQGLMPFFTAVIAWGFWPAMVTENRSPGRILIGGLAATAMVMTYVQALGLVLQLGPLILLFRRRIPRRPLVASLVIFFVALLAYGYGLARNIGVSQGDLQSFVGESDLRLTTEGLDHALRLVSGKDFATIYTPEADTVRQVLSIVADILLGVALVSGVILAFLALQERSQPRRLAIVLLIWFGVPVLVMTLSPYPVHPHYLLLTLPAGHLLAAWGIAPLLEHRALRWVLALLLVAFGVISFANLSLRGRANAANPTGPNFNGWTLQLASELGQKIRSLTSGEDYPRQLYAEGEAPLLSSMSATYMAPLQGTSFPSFIVLKEAQPLLYVLVNSEPQLASIGFWQQTLPEETLNAVDGTRVSFWQTLPINKDAALALPEVALGWSSDAGLTLLGYTLEKAPTGASVPSIGVTTYWRVEDLHPSRGEWFVGAFYQLLNEGWQTVSNVQEHAQWGYRWELGDVYVEQVQIPIPDDVDQGPYRLAIGLYDSIHDTNYFLNGPDERSYAAIIPVEISP